MFAMQDFMAALPPAFCCQIGIKSTMADKPINQRHLNEFSSFFPIKHTTALCRPCLKYVSSRFCVSVVSGGIALIRL
jgi:hypothetical protein